MTERIEKSIYLILTALSVFLINFCNSIFFEIDYRLSILSASVLILLIYLYKNHWKSWMRPLYLITWQSFFFLGSLLLSSLLLYILGSSNKTIALTGGTAIYLSGFFWGNVLRVREYGDGMTRIIHISDLHLGHGLGKGHLRRVWHKVAALPGDIIVITGDMIEDINFLDREVISLLKTEKRPVIFVTGNHEAYMNSQLLREKLEEAEIFFLDNNTYKWNNISFHGIADKGHRLSKISYPDRGKGRNILLVHQPPQENPPFDLTLSGHVHDGQVFPFNLIFTLLLKHSTGLYEGSRVFVSPGTGSFGGSFRLAKPMEISIIRF